MNVKINSENTLEVRGSPAGDFNLQLPKFLEFSQKYWFKAGRKWITCNDRRIGRVLQVGDRPLDMHLEYGYLGMVLRMVTGSSSGARVSVDVKVPLPNELEKRQRRLHSIQLEGHGLVIYHDLFEPPLDVEVLDAHLDPISRQVSALVTLPAEPDRLHDLVRAKRRRRFIVTLPNDFTKSSREYLFSAPGTGPFSWSYASGRVGDGVRGFLLNLAEKGAA